MLIRATALLFLSGLLSMMLFTLKYEVQTEEARLAKVNRAIQDNQESLHLLAAEWAHLNDPERLRRLSEQHLDVAVAAPHQVITLEDLANQSAVPPADPVAGFDRIPPRSPAQRRNAEATSPKGDEDFTAAMDRAIGKEGQ